jgi:hypothetical protein
MATIVSDSTNASYDGNLSKVNGFYRAEAVQTGLGPAASVDALTTERFINVTFSNAGNLKGIMVYLYSSSIQNDRSVVCELQQFTGSWATVETVTLTAAQVCPEYTDDYALAADHIVPFKFAGTTAVTTAGSTWRFRFTQTGGTVGTVSLVRTATAGAYQYAAWCDNAVSHNDNDVLIVVDQVVIDKTATCGSGGNAAIIVCRNTDTSEANICNLKWSPTPVASYTLTLGGFIYISAYGGFRIGTSTVRIPYAQKAIVYFNGAYAISSPRPVSGGTVTSAKMSVICYGERIKTYTELAADANNGQKNIVTTESTGWAIGDKIFIGKQNVKGVGDVAEYTIDTISGTDIAVTANIATNVRKAGATVVRLDGSIYFDSADFATTVLVNTIHWVFDGCYISKQRNSVTTLSYADSPLSTAMLYTHSVIRADAASFHQFVLQPSGFTAYECVFVRTGLIQMATYFVSSPASYRSGNISITNCRFLSMGYGNFTSNTTMQSAKVTYSNNTHENIIINIAAGAVVFGVDSVFNDNTFWGGPAFSASYCYCLKFGLAVNPTVLRNYFDNCGYAMQAGSFPCISAVAEDCVFGAETANTVDLTWNTGNYTQLLVKSPTGNLTIDTSESAFFPIGAYLKITDYNDTTDDDRGYYPFGEMFRTKASLSDTTVHTTGGSAIRLKPTYVTESFYWEQKVPTGNIQNKDMMVGVWCKINNAAYYAGTHTMPRITVDYDDGTTVYGEAAQSTDWQFLFVPFKPITTFGQIKVRLSGLTDATSTNAYIYFDDMSVLYPAGYTLSLGSMDLWAEAEPVTPSISTSISALDVWAADTTIFGTDTVGDKVNSIKKDTGLIPALL